MKKFFRWMGVTMVVCSAVEFTAMRFCFPELTETQLFLKFWAVALSAVLGTGIYVIGERL